MSAFIENGSQGTVSGLSFSGPWHGPLKDTRVYVTPWRRLLENVCFADINNMLQRIRQQWFGPLNICICKRRLRGPAGAMLFLEQRQYIWIVSFGLQIRTTTARACWERRAALQWGRLSKNVGPIIQSFSMSSSRDYVCCDLLIRIMAYMLSWRRTRRIRWRLISG